MKGEANLTKNEDFRDLMDTVKENFKEMRKRIKEKTFDLDNTEESSGKTALINVIEMRNYTEQMWVLLDYGADPNVRDNTGKTALHYACQVDRKDMIICLLLFGASLDIKDNEEKTPLDDYKDDAAVNAIKEKVDDVKREFISLTRKRRKFLKYIFDEIDRELGSKLINEYNIAAYYERINKETNEEALKDAHSFIEQAKLYKNPYEESSTITFEEFIVAICRIVKIHGMKIIDDFINRYKSIRVKIKPKQAAEEEGEGKEENKEN